MSSSLRSADSELPLEFHDKIQLPYGDYPEEVFIPWDDPEKELVKGVYQKAVSVAPGLMKRVTTYRPLRFYRCRKSRRNVNGLALGKLNGMYLYDSLFDRDDDQLLYTFLHECAHLADLTEFHETSSGWNDIVRSRMEKVREEVSSKGGKYFLRSLERSDLYEGYEQFKDLPNTHGLPSLYSCRNSAETLAECVEEYLRGGYKPPTEILSYIETHFLSSPKETEPELAMFHEAMEALVEKKPETALQHLTDLLDSHPHMGHIAYHRAKILTDMGEFEKAAEDLDAAASSFDHGERILYHLSIWRGHLFEKRGDPEAALRQYMEATKQLPYYSYAYRRSAKIHADRHEHDKAIEFLSTAISYSPDDEYLFRTRSFQFFENEEYEKALKDMNTVLDARNGEYEGFDFRYLWERALIRMELEDYEGALRDIALSNENSPMKYPMVDVIKTRSEAYMKLKQFEKALEDLTWLRRAYSSDLKIYEQRLECFRALGRLEEAESEWTEKIAKNENDLQAYLLRAALRRELGKNEEAAEDYDLVYEKTSENLRATQAVAWGLATEKASKGGNPDQANRFALRALALTDEKDPFSLAIMAAALAAGENFESAIEWQKKAVEHADEATKPKFQEQLESYEKGTVPW